MTKLTRPINAYSMADFEQITNPGAVAEFARKKGSKDKKKRMSRGMMAGIGAGALGAAGAIGTGVRYGGAALATRKAKKNLRTPYTGIGADLAKGGARGQLGKDVQGIKEGLSGLGSKVQSYDYKGIPSRIGSSAQRAGEGALNVGGRLASSIASKPLTSAALGLGGAAAIGGAGYGVYKMLQNKKKNKNK